MVGVFVRLSDNIVLSNVIAKNNDAYGIHIYDVPSTKLLLCQSYDDESYDDRDSPLQRYAIYAQGTTEYIEITSCQLTPNAIGAISNGAGAVITITDTEKMLARF